MNQPAQKVYIMHHKAMATANLVDSFYTTEYKQPQVLSLSRSM